MGRRYDYCPVEERGARARGDVVAGRVGHRLLGADVTPLWYTQYQPHLDRDPEPARHFAAMMCEKAGIRGLASIRPYIFLRDREIADGQIREAQIAIQSSAGAGTLLKNKEWLPERFQAVVNALSGQFNFVQVGTVGDPKLDNVVDLTGRTTLRQAAAVLSRSRLFIGVAGGLMHLARAVDCPAVIVYGGRERPEISGYVCNKNIRTTIACSPCWQRSRCDHGRACMTDIYPDTVVAAVKEVLDSRRDELPVETMSIG
jgi:ADP-heptose:LPS heptosyltransferase